MPKTTRPARPKRPSKATVLLVAIARELEAHSGALQRVEGKLGRIMQAMEALAAMSPGRLGAP
jgi:hypothetical protein